MSLVAVCEHLLSCAGPIVAMSFLILLLLIAIYAGVFQYIFFGREQTEGLSFVFVEYRGAYPKVGPAFRKSWELVSEKFPEFAGFMAGLYFDNPQETPSEKCRAYVGVCSRRSIPDTTVSAMREEGLNVRKLEVVPALVTRFPFGSSYIRMMVAASRVYPAFMAQGHAIKGCAMEAYEGEEVRFIFPQEIDPAYVHEDDL